MPSAGWLAVGVSNASSSHLHEAEFLSTSPLSPPALEPRESRKPAGHAGRWLREPLLHFMLLGGLLYAASRVFAPGAADMQIQVDAARVERLVRLYQLQTGAAPTDAQREQLIADFVRDEVLYREARKLGLDKGDEMVRRRLVQKMEFLQSNIADLEKPSEAQLRAFHRENAAQFTEPARLSFTHVYFSPDGRSPGAARAAAAAALAAHLASGADMARGDRAPVASQFDNVGRDEVQLTFGHSPIVDALMQAQPGQWVGPVESGYGWHLVRVTERQNPVLTSFEQAKAPVTEAWQREAGLQAERTRLAALMRQYTVIRNDQGISRTPSNSRPSMFNTPEKP
jgi:hypothetical protein